MEIIMSHDIGREFMLNKDHVDHVKQLNVNESVNEKSFNDNHLLVGAQLASDEPPQPIWI